MSESGEPEAGQIWPSPRQEEEDDFEGEESGTPEKYVPDHLGRPKVHGAGGGRLQVKLGTAALERLFVKEGDRVEIHEHPHGLLVVPSFETVGIESAPVESDEDDRAALPRGASGGAATDEPADDWTQVQTAGCYESGPIPPEVPWSEMVAYDCKSCWTDCINHEDTGPAKAEECRFCFGCPELE